MHIHTYKCLLTYVLTYVPTYIHTYIHTYLHTYLPAYIPTYLHTYLSTYLHTYIHAYIHTYIHTYIDRIWLLCWAHQSRQLRVVTCVAACDEKLPFSVIMTRLNGWAVLKSQDVTNWDTHQQWCICSHGIIDNFILTIHQCYYLFHAMMIICGYSWQENCTVWLSFVFLW